MSTKGKAKTRRAEAEEPVTAVRDRVLAFKREQILKAAADLFYERGYQGTTLDQVAQRLGVTKPFIYYHFQNKAEILHQIAHPSIERINAALDEALHSEGSAAARLRKAIIAITETMLDQQRYTAIYFREEKNFTPQAKAAQDRLRRAHDVKLRRLLEEGIASGEFRIDDSRFCVLAISGMTNWGYVWFNPDGRLTMAEVGEKMAELVLRMVGADEAAAGGAR